jgi:glutamate 5-kinase
METKLIAADIATAAGVTTIITSSSSPRVVREIIDWSSQQASLSLPGSLPSQAPTLLPRPPHTSFTPSPAPMRSLKSWTFHTLHPAGAVVIDHGAHTVLSRRDSGGRLLSVGVLDVKGTFAAGQAVRILAPKSSGPSSHSRSGSVITANNAPGLNASSVAIATPPIPSGAQANSIPPSPSLSRRNSDSANLHQSLLMSSLTLTQTNNSDILPIVHEVIPDDQLIEVGRGLANYNSAEIAKVKGQKRSL